MAEELQRDNTTMEKEKTGIISQETRNIINRFEYIDSQVFGNDDYRAKNRDKLIEPNIIRDNHNTFKGVSIIFEEFRKHKDNYHTFLEAVAQREQEIMRVDVPLGKQVVKFESEETGEASVLVELSKIMKDQDINELLSNFRENENRYRAGILENIKDKSFATKLVYMLHIISSYEEYVLRNKLSELREAKGNQYDIIDSAERELKERHGIVDKSLTKKLDRAKNRSKDSIREEIKLLGEAGRAIEEWSASDNFEQRLHQFREILRNIAISSKDGILIRRIKQTNSTKRMLYFDYEYNFLFGMDQHWDKGGFNRVSLFQAVKLTYGKERAEWEDFLNSVSRKYTKNASYIREHFGDNEAAAMIENIGKKAGDSPEEWRKGLFEIGKSLFSKERKSTILDNSKNSLLSILGQRIIELEKEINDAMEAIRNIFIDRIKHLRKQREKSINEMKKLVNKKLNELQKEPKKMAMKIIELARKREKQLLKEWEPTKVELRKKEDSLMTELAEYIRIREDVLDMEEHEKKFEENLSIIRNKIKWDNYLSKAFNVLPKLNPEKAWFELNKNIMGGIMVSDSFVFKINENNKSIINFFNNQLREKLDSVSNIASKIVENQTELNRRMGELLILYYKKGE
ncbi:hypothetical protein HQ529_01680 [Candidatus Woesearchaeota archaeon]|nr:hypothetical protein [Candidatus Woesearchaeota archaeon]